MKNWRICPNCGMYIHMGEGNFRYFITLQYCPYCEKPLGPFEWSIWSPNLQSPVEYEPVKRNQIVLQIEINDSEPVDWKKIKTIENDPAISKEAIKIKTEYAEKGRGLDFQLCTTVLSIITTNILAPITVGIITDRLIELLKDRKKVEVKIGNTKVKIDKKQIGDLLNLKLLRMLEKRESIEEAISGHIEDIEE